MHSCYPYYCNIEIASKIKSHLKNMKKQLLFMLFAGFSCLQISARSGLPVYDKQQITAQGDWLIDPVDAKATVYTTREDWLVFSNGLVSRTFTLHPNVASIGLEELTHDISYLRSIRPEASLVIDGFGFDVGGLTGQPVHNYILKEWIPGLKAAPESFKMTGYRIEEIKERFPWKKRLEWMPQDMPWPPPGKELIFTYRLDDQAIESLSGRTLRDDSRPVLVMDNFTRLSPEWKLNESKAYDRNSFINEGKPGEIMALANTAVFAEQDFKKEAKVVIAKINPGTDRSAGWGPGLALVFPDKVIKMNIRGQDNRVVFFNGQQENGSIDLNSNQHVFLRFELKGDKLEASASTNGIEWRQVNSHDLQNNEIPLKVRVGKMDGKGGNSDSPDKGEEIRCKIEEFSMLGDIPAGSQKNTASLQYLKDIEVNVHYELYDNIPVLSKWLTVNNLSGQNITVNSFKSEILAAFEPESTVDLRNRWMHPNITVETDYVFGGMSEEYVFASSAEWKKDPLYNTQVNYDRTTPCLLEVAPKKGPEQTVAPGGRFDSFRAWELLNDSWDRERKGLAYRRMMRTIAPWVTENPILMHVRRADDASVKKAIDQCAEVGFEQVIMTFGSGFNAEDISEANVGRLKALADYAHSKNITLGGYSLLASRRINAQNDVVLPKGERPRFGNSPCVESKWGQEYFDKLYTLYEKTGLDIFEHDGSYPGDFCYSTTHPGHSGVNDSQWNQYKRVSDFYKWCRGKGIYLNVPDYYFLSGSNKTGMGYRENNWSLPRAQQEIIERQNIYDGTWLKTPSMGWMFVPLVAYHGGGKEATIEPLKEHLPHYDQRMANLFGAGVQACYRGPQLYDTPETKEVVMKWVNFYKKHRRILDSDIIHIRRPDGKDYDAILHVDPSGEEKGLLMVYNPLNEPIKQKIKVNLYYTGLKSKAKITEKEGKTQNMQIDRDYNAVFNLDIPAKGYTWFVIK